VRIAIGQNLLPRKAKAERQLRHLSRFHTKEWACPRSGAGPKPLEG
jgi:hypothetical protein